jgi:hypothetical protein
VRFVAPNAQGYVLEIDSASGYHQVLPASSLVANEAGPGSVDLVVERPITLPATGTYTWRVRGLNPLDVRDATEPGYVPRWTTGPAVEVSTVQAQPVGKPAGLVPRAGTVIACTGEAVSVPLEWTPVPGASGYLVYLSRLADGPLLDYVDVQAQTRIADVPLTPGSYQWLVVARDASGTHRTWGDLTYFEVVRDLAAPRVTAATVRTGEAADAVNLEWLGADPQTVTLQLFYSGAPGWLSFSNLLVTRTGPGRGWVSLGTQWRAGTDNYLLLQGTTAAGLCGEQSRLFVVANP